MFNLGPVLQKEALNDFEEIKPKNIFSSIIKMLRNRKWFAGFLVVNGGGMLYIVAVQLIGITTVQPLLNLGVLTMAVFSTRRLGERFDLKGKVGVAVIVIMPIFITLGAVSEPQLLNDYLPVTIFTITVLSFTSVVSLLTRKFHIAWAFISGMVLGVAAQFTQWFSNIFFGASTIWAGLLNGIVPFSLMMLLNLLAGFYLTQVGLQRNPASIFTPVYSTVNILITIIGGMLIFHQNVGNIPCYIIGVIMGTVAILLLSRYNIDGEKVRDHE
ncbi:MAG: hypothetical protein ACTSUE_17495 [Promethearchaeota archaeon]